MGRFTAKNRGNYQLKIGSMRWNSLRNLGWYNCIIDPKNEKSKKIQFKEYEKL